MNNPLFSSHNGRPLERNQSQSLTLRPIANRLPGRAFLMCLVVVLEMILMPALWSGTVSYTYDAAGRLVAADYQNGALIGYAYDVSGNLVGEVMQTTSVGRMADLAVSLVYVPQPIIAGQPARLLCTVANSGPDATTETQVAIALPPALQLISVNASQGTAAGINGGIQAQLGIIAPDGYAQIEAHFVVPVLGDFTCTAALYSPQDTTPADNTVAASFSPVPAVDLVLEHFPLLDPLVLGSRLLVQLEVANRSGHPATSVVLTNFLPDGFEVLAATANQGWVSQEAGMVIVRWASLPPGASAQVLIEGRPSSEGIYTNSASVIAAEHDLDLHNNTNSATTTVVTPNLIVLNADNEGAGSLRQALLDANQQPGRDVIAFRIPGSEVPRIQPLTPLPEILDSVVLDGLTQTAGWVEVNGAQAGAEADGLRLATDSSIVRGLVINGFAKNGMLVTGPRNLIQACRLGTDVAGTTNISNGESGIQVYDAPGNRLGGRTIQSRNLLSGNVKYGVYLVEDGTTETIVTGNYVGTDASGTQAVSNLLAGIMISAPANRIGGTSPGEGNLVSGNNNNGINIWWSNDPDNLVQGNFIGTDASGTYAIANRGQGIEVMFSPRTRIGGETTGARNLISGNYNSGIRLDRTANCLIQGNFIGVDVTGTQALGNRVDGILLYSATNSLIGGRTPGARNVISGQLQYDGIEISSPSWSTDYSSTGNLIEGNLIGTDVTGTRAIGNRNGISAFNCAHDNWIGGGEPAARNVISGNRSQGIQLTQSNVHHLVIQGNYIGLDATGLKALTNASHGVGIYGSPNHLVGGLEPGLANVISGNGGHGLLISRSRFATNDLPYGNRILGNVIGSSVTGMALGNQQNGIFVSDSPSNSIGGLELGAGNSIAFNQGHGVQILTNSIRNPILGNAIHSNQGLGIELGQDNDGVTPNDSGDADLGANEGQNFPVITAFTEAGLEVKGELQSQPQKQYLIELFACLQSDPSGYGEGDVLVGRVQVTTDNQGLASFVLALEQMPAAARFLTATATDPEGNTSEFSLAFPCRAAPSDQDQDGIADAIEAGAPHQGDGNQDGIADATQAHVISLPSARGRYLTLVLPSTFHLISIRAMADPAPSNSPPAGLRFPLNVFEFEIGGIPDQALYPVELFLGGNWGVNGYYNFGPTADQIESHWYDFLGTNSPGAVIAPSPITLYVADGQRGDHDLQANGRILTCGGPVEAGAFRFSRIQRLPHDQIEMILETEPGVRYRLETSSNFLRWSEHMVFEATGEQQRLTQPLPAGTTNQFFRAVTLP